MEPAPVTPRRRVVAGVLLCIALPALLVVVDGAAYYTANRTTGTILIAGEEREYIVHVPGSYDSTRPTPLVLSIHGAGVWPSMQMNVSRWNDAADRHGFIAVYPGGDGRVFKVWTRPGPDMQFVAALIDRLQGEYNIDPRRIYANGLSNGGGVSYAISCILADRIAAVGAVSAAVTMSADLCPSAKPVPVIAFHGTADRVTPYHGGKVFIAPQPFPGIPLWIENWARRNGCDSTPVESPVAPDVGRRQYDKCRDNATVALYTIDGGGHTWPGGQQLTAWLLGPTNRSIDATAVMWEFFREHSLK